MIMNLRLGKNCEPKIDTCPGGGESVRQNYRNPKIGDRH